MRRRGVVAGASLAAALLGLLVARAALAVCADPVADTGLVSRSLGVSALGPAGTQPTLGVTIVPVGSTLLFRKVSDLTQVCAPISLDSSILHSPVPVLASDGKYAVFVATTAGTIYRINIEGSTCTQMWSRNLRRAGCINDGISASPVVHLRQYASDTFKARYVTDLVYVATMYQADSTCASGHNTANRLYALQSTDGLPVWIFNETAADQVDLFSQAPYLDVTNDKLYAGSMRGYTATQHTLWAIDVLTGARAWSANVGALENMPMVVSDRIYVGNSTGQVKAVSRLDGTVAWTKASGATRITANIFAERRPPYVGLIGVVGTNGYVYLIRDDTTSGTVVWGKRPKNVGLVDVNAKSRVAFDPSSGKLYVGTGSGVVSQMDINTGDTDTARTAGGGTVVVGDPSFVFEDTGGTPDFDDVRMIVGNSAGTLTKFCTPWASELGLYRNKSCSSDLTCGTTGNTQCRQAKCLNGICTTVPINENGTCNTGVACTSPGTCIGGTCVGKTECERKFELCQCYECGSTPITRTFSYGQGNDSTFTLSNACVTVGTNVRTVAVLHLVDDLGRPLTKAYVEMSYPLTAQSLPLWVDPSTNLPLPASTNKISTADYVVESARPGTYFGILTARGTGTDYNDLVISASVAAPECVKGSSFGARLRIASAGSGGGAFNGGCNLLNERNESRYLRVQVVREDTGEAIKDAVVMVGYKSVPTKFQSKFENFITSGPGDRPNVGHTDASGLVEFNDLGDNLNGPFVVTAGAQPQSGLEFATVTLQGIAASDVRVALPVIRSVKPARLEKGDLLARHYGSASPYTRLGFVAQKRPLDFFANMNPESLMDVNECAASGLVAPENAFISRTSTTEDKFWNKNFKPRLGDTLQTSYHQTTTANAWPTSGQGIDLRGYLMNTTYEQLGFLFGVDLVSGTSYAPAINLGLNPAKPYLKLAFTPPQYAYLDYVGTSLTDYSNDKDVGRGAGDLFLQGHAAASWSLEPSSVTVPFFDLDGYGSLISNAGTTNIAQVTGMYLMDKDCGSGSPDPRCGYSVITKSMRTGRTSVLKRYDYSFAGGCMETWEGNAGQVQTKTMDTIPPILDLNYASAGGGFYRTCPGGHYKADGLCCAGTWSNNSCSTSRAVGDYQKHIVYLKRTTYHQVGSCTGSWQPSVERIPRWVFFTPGNAATIFVPDLPGTSAGFPFACGGVDTSACASYQRMGLPVRRGSGASCPTGVCLAAGEKCVDLRGVKECAYQDTANGTWVFEDYEWHVDHEAIDLVGDTCQFTRTPCTPTTLPVLNTQIDFPRFDGEFDFGETAACLTARSSNDMIVN